MADQKIEDPVREFLVWVDEQRRAGADVGALVAVVQALRGEVAQMRGELSTVKRISLMIAKDRLVDKDRGERHGRRLDKIESALQLVTTAPSMTSVPDYQFDPAERTGVHNVRDIERQHRELVEKIEAEEDRKRDSEIWWKRQRVLWAVAAVGFVIAIAISTGCSVAVARLMPPPPAATPTKNELLPFFIH